MEGNTCDVDHLDSDVLLPPRKRLLAGLRKQIFDVYPCTPSSPTDDVTGLEFDIRLNDLLKFHSDDCNHSIEEIVEASRMAALKAVELAKAARAVAEEKAAKAAEAMAAAKSAMELVVTISEVVTDTDNHSKKNKMKKHVPVEMLYNNKCKVTKDRRTDEDLARTVSRTKNSTSNSRNHKHKRPKSSFPSENAKLQNVSMSREGNRPSTSNGFDIAGIKASNGPSQEKELIRVDFSKADYRKMENGKAKAMISKEEFGESPDDLCTVDKKKARMKQKKLPLSNCSFRSKGNPKKDMNSKSSSSPTEKINKVTGINEPKVERSSTLK